MKMKKFITLFAILALLSPFAGGPEANAQSKKKDKTETQGKAKSKKEAAAQAEAARAEAEAAAQAALEARKELLASMDTLLRANTDTLMKH